jgi:hypothetical protein
MNMLPRKPTGGQKAKDLLTRASAFRKEQAKAAAVDAAKTARLRALRLAKEAAERVANPAELPSTSSRMRAVRRS